MKHTIKTLSLSIDEIRQLIEISDPDHRQQVLQSLTNATTDPDEEINPDDYAETHPMALRIAEKVNKKINAAKRRRLKRSQKAKQPESETTSPTVVSERQPAPDEKIFVELTAATVDRLLWLKQNHKLWRKAINCIIEAISGSNIPHQLRTQIQPLLKRLFNYLDPLIRQASQYYKTPKRFRPRFATNQ